MKIAVCVKYVPVISRITFDYEKKIIIREGVPSEVNLFDLLGLVRAVELKQGPEDQVVVISMGPPTAREGLLQCLALGADRAVLLTDRALAGSDTLATARALALALEQEQPDLIICGRNSTDSETGQVGPEVAELMGIPHVSHVSELDLAPDPGFIQVRRVTDLGYQTIRCPLPALVCVTEGVAPELFPNREQLEEAQKKPLDELSCAQLSSDSSLFGAAGSPTSVEDIRLVEPNRLGVVFEDGTPEESAQQVAQLVKERLGVLDAGGRDQGVAADSARYPDRRDKSIWVVAEKSDSGLRKVTLEILGKARELTSFTQSEVAVVLIGPPDDQLTAELASYGADRVLVLDNTGLGPVCGRRVSEALSAAIDEARPYAVLFASTADGRDLASRIAARLQLGLTGDAIDLEIDGDGRLVQLKPALGGNVVAPILSRTLPNMVTMRPGVLTAIDPDSSARAGVDTIGAPDFQGNDIEVLEEHFQEDIGAIALSQAQVVLGVGMGIGGPENLPKIQALAGSLGATLATSRNVVHAGWLPHQVQVGISGRTIAPKVYIAVGLRGAFNHTVGIQKAGVIVAINTNRRHTIFRAADYGIVGDWETFLPPLVEALKPVLADLG
ncbi:MAG: electron transfer flavoprotein alpha/ beta subunit [Chloroflexi bacterium]|nr:electron transfer flavoprotein alpha/ beta subunit [Chloroflexota bacterium]